MRAKFRLKFEDYSSKDLIIEDMAYVQFDAVDHCIYMKSLDGTKYQSTFNIDEFEFATSVSDFLVVQGYIDFTHFTYDTFVIFEEEDEDDDEGIYIDE